MDSLKLYTVVHPIDEGNPWNAPEGWRWAIHTDDRYDVVKMHYEIPGSDANCIIAGWQPSKADAESELSVVLMACRRTLLAVGGSSTVAQSVLADCPLNADILGELAVLA
jgi:hypothetical protein